MQSDIYDFSIKVLSAIGKMVFSLFVIFALIIILTSLFIQYRSHPPVNCLSNLKQVGLGLMMYTQDYDERFPPAHSFYKTKDGNMFPARWGMAYQVAEGGNSIKVPGLIYPYVKRNDLFRCPSISQKNPWNPFQMPATTPERETYMYNDLAATENLEIFTNPANTILIADGEDIERNVGHSWDKDLPPQEATFDGKGKCSPGRGATLQNAPTRHNSRANYFFADGHCRALAPEEIYFPPRSSADISHKGNASGPDPAGKMVYQKRKYKATFHVK